MQTDEMRVTYHAEGDYWIPNLVPPEAPKIGVWGERRRQYLRKAKRPVYSAMLMQGTLNAHLEETDRQAEELLDRLTKQLAEQEGVTEALKAEDQMEWARRMNSIRSRAEEVVLSELIYESGC